MEELRGSQFNPVDFEEVLNSLQSSHAALRDEVDQLKDKVFLLDSNFTNCDISMKDIAKTEQQQARELHDALKRLEAEVYASLNVHKSDTASLVMQASTNLESQMKGLKYELSGVLEQLGTRQGESLLKLKQLFDSTQARSQAIEDKLLSMNEGVNDLIDQFEVSQGVIETLDKRVAKAEIDLARLP